MADLFGPQVALFKGAYLRLGLAQIEEQLLLCASRPHLHKRPRPQDIFLDRGANPPHGIGRQAKAALGLKFLDRLHQADIAFGDHLANGQAIAAIAHGNLGHETQV